MTVTITIKVHAEHQEEFKTLPQAYLSYKDFTEKQHAEGVFGDPSRVNLRFLVDCEKTQSPSDIAAHTTKKGDDTNVHTQSGRSTEGADA